MVAVCGVFGSVSLVRDLDCVVEKLL
uniref:Uncharacterized protein MANES_18G057800 n=1 Tax=Rhizophora mucronata TaxID=61149 RepID=A0A2P2KRR2_RHIMU